MEIKSKEEAIKFLEEKKAIYTEIRKWKYKVWDNDTSDGKKDIAFFKNKKELIDYANRLKEDLDN